eukprot:3312-Heterococcus_DN1.PRE.4
MSYPVLVPLRIMRIHACVYYHQSHVMRLLPVLERVCTWSVAAAHLRASVSQEHQSKITIIGSRG